MDFSVLHKNENVPEPSNQKKNASLSFVVQRHQSYHLYYDFCIEVKGALRTWAMPRWPTMNHRDKRLAMMVEDHPLEYKNFEGEVPTVTYGSDTIEIWDSGTYTPIDEKGKAVSEDYVKNAIEKGNFNFLLQGTKLKGEFALIKLHQDDDKAWLLIKQK